LSTRRERWAAAAAALAAGARVSAAARASGLRRETISRRLKDPAFKAEVERLRQDDGLAARARKVVEEALAGSGTPAATRARLAMQVLASNLASSRGSAEPERAREPFTADGAARIIASALRAVVSALRRGTVRPAPEALQALQAAAGEAFVFDLASPPPPSDLGAPTAVPGAARPPPPLPAPALPGNVLPLHPAPRWPTDF
jgi:hypothetical protein